jgi:hypothetical protein
MRYATSLILAAVFAAAPHGASAQSACRGADSVSAGLITGMRDMLTSKHGRVYNTLLDMKIPVATVTNTVVLVTDSRVCQKAAQAYAAALAGSSLPPSGRVYVVKVGNTYLVRDPAMARHGREIDMVLSSKYAVLSKQFG